MKILLSHHRYRKDLPSGENNVVDELYRLLLESPDITVERFERTGDQYLGAGVCGRISAGIDCLGVLPSMRMLSAKRALEEFAPDLIHLHNPWPGLGIGFFRLAREKRVPIVWTLHNYRLFSSNERVLTRKPNGRYAFTRPTNDDQRLHLSRLGRASAHSRQFGVAR